MPTNVTFESLAGEKVEPCLPKCAGGHGHLLGNLGSQLLQWKPQRLWCHLCQVRQHQAGDCLSKGSNCHLSQMCHLDKSISSTFVHRDKPLVIQFTLKHEQNIDCSGGYIKLFDCKLDQVDMHGQSPYNIMFGSGSCDLAPRRSTSALSTRARTT